MSKTGFLALRITCRWPLLLAATIVSFFPVAYIAPRLVAACGGPSYAALCVSLIPLLWAVCLVVMSKGSTERVLAYGAFVLAIVLVYLSNSLSLEYLFRSIHV